MISFCKSSSEGLLLPELSHRGVAVGEAGHLGLAQVDLAAGRADVGRALAQAFVEVIGLHNQQLYPCGTESNFV